MEFNNFDSIFDAPALEEMFPAERSDHFFEALLGDATEGAYTIALTLQGYGDNRLRFYLELRRRPQKCLVCNLTYGLPEVFYRHPIINLKGLLAEVENRLDGKARIGEWDLGATEEVSTDLHRIPLTIQVTPLSQKS